MSEKKSLYNIDPTPNKIYYPHLLKIVEEYAMSVVDLERHLRFLHQNQDILDIDQPDHLLEAFKHSDSFQSLPDGEDFSYQIRVSQEKKKAYQETFIFGNHEDASELSVIIPLSIKTHQWWLDHLINGFESHDKNNKKEAIESIYLKFGNQDFMKLSLKSIEFQYSSEKNVDEQYWQSSHLKYPHLQKVLIGLIGHFHISPEMIDRQHLTPDILMRLLKFSPGLMGEFYKWKHLEIVKNLDLNFYREYLKIPNTLFDSLPENIKNDLYDLVIHDVLESNPSSERNKFLALEVADHIQECGLNDHKVEILIKNNPDLIFDFPQKYWTEKNYMTAVEAKYDIFTQIPKYDLTDSIVDLAIQKDGKSINLSPDHFRTPERYLMASQDSQHPSIYLIGLENHFDKQDFYRRSLMKNGSIFQQIFTKDINQDLFKIAFQDSEKPVGFSPKDIAIDHNDLFLLKYLPIIDGVENQLRIMKYFCVCEPAFLKQIPDFLCEFREEIYKNTIINGSTSTIHYIPKKYLTRELIALAGIMSFSTLKDIEFCENPKYKKDLFIFGIDECIDIILEGIERDPFYILDFLSSDIKNKLSFEETTLKNMVDLAIERVQIDLSEGRVGIWDYDCLIEHISMLFPERPYPISQNLQSILNVFKNIFSNPLTPDKKSEFLTYLPESDFQQSI